MLLRVNPDCVPKGMNRASATGSRTGSVFGFDFVSGEVRNPGKKLLDAGSGPLQALSEAGGFTDYARMDAIYVLRKEPGYATPVRIRFTWAALSRNEGSAPPSA